MRGGRYEGQERTRKANDSISRTRALLRHPNDRGKTAKGKEGMAIRLLSCDTRVAPVKAKRAISTLNTAERGDWVRGRVKVDEIQETDDLVLPKRRYDPGHYCEAYKTLRGGDSRPGSGEQGPVMSYFRKYAIKIGGGSR